MPNPGHPSNYNQRQYNPVRGNRPCKVIPVLRKRYCGREDGHYADVQVTYYYCGHTASFCASALPWMMQGFKDKTRRKGSGVCPVCYKRSSYSYQTKISRT